MTMKTQDLTPPASDVVWNLPRQSSSGLCLVIAVIGYCCRHAPPADINYNGTALSLLSLGSPVHRALPPWGRACLLLWRVAIFVASSTGESFILKGLPQKFATDAKQNILPKTLRLSYLLAISLYHLNKEIKSFLMVYLTPHLMKY